MYQVYHVCTIQEAWWVEQHDAAYAYAHAHTHTHTHTFMPTHLHENMYKCRDTDAHFISIHNVSQVTLCRQINNESLSIHDRKSGAIHKMP